MEEVKTKAKNKDRKTILTREIPDNFLIQTTKEKRSIESTVKALLLRIEVVPISAAVLFLLDLSGTQ